jgi:hypothetical protein
MNVVMIRKELNQRSAENAADAQAMPCESHLNAYDRVLSSTLSRRDARVLLTGAKERQLAPGETLTIQFGGAADADSRGGDGAASGEAERAKVGLVLDGSLRMQVAGITVGTIERDCWYGHVPFVLDALQPEPPKPQRKQRGANRAPAAASAKAAPPSHAPAGAETGSAAAPTAPAAEPLTQQQAAVRAGVLVAAALAAPPSAPAPPVAPLGRSAMPSPSSAPVADGSSTGGAVGPADASAAGEPRLGVPARSNPSSTAAPGNGTALPHASTAPPNGTPASNATVPCLNGSVPAPNSNAPPPNAPSPGLVTGVMTLTATEHSLVLEWPSPELASCLAANPQLDSGMHALWNLDLARRLSRPHAHEAYDERRLLRRARADYLELLQALAACGRLGAQQLEYLQAVRARLEVDDLAHQLALAELAASGTTSRGMVQALRMMSAYEDAGGSSGSGAASAGPISSVLRRMATGGLDVEPPPDVDETVPSRDAVAAQ